MTNKEYFSEMLNKNKKFNKILDSLIFPLTAFCFLSFVGGFIAICVKINQNGILFSFIYFILLSLICSVIGVFIGLLENKVFSRDEKDA